MIPAKLSQCPDCGGLGFFRRDVPHDHPDFGKPIKCTNQFHAGEQLARLEKISGLRGSDLAIRLTGITGNGENRPMIEAAKKMAENPLGWLYIWGGPGNAKTVALMAIVNEINEANAGPAMYIKFSQLIEWMRDSFRERDILDRQPFANLGYIERFKRIKEIRVLAIDEMDKARSTPFADEFRFDFLDERYQSAIRKETATIFASNSAPETLPEPIYDRVRDKRFGIVENKAPSARPDMEW